MCRCQHHLEKSMPPAWLSRAMRFLWCCNGRENSKERAHTHTPKQNIYRLWMMVNHVFSSIFFYPKYFWKVSRIAESIGFVCHMVKTGACSALLQGRNILQILITSLLLLGKKAPITSFFSQLMIDLTWLFVSQSPTIQKYSDLKPYRFWIKNGAPESASISGMSCTAWRDWKIWGLYIWHD